MSYRSLLLLMSLISLLFLLRTVTALLQKSLHPVLLEQFNVKINVIQGRIIQNIIYPA